MNSQGGKQENGEDHYPRGYNTGAPPLLSALVPGPLSNMAAGVTDLNTPSGSEVRQELIRDAASKKFQEESAQLPAMASRGEQQPLQGHDAVAVPSLSSPTSQDPADITKVTTMSASKTGGKRRKGGKRRRKAQQLTKADNSAKPQLPTILPQPTAGVDANDNGVPVHAATSSGLKECSGEGATGKRQEKAPEAPEGTVPETAVGGTTDGGQEQMAQVSSHHPEEVPEQPPASKWEFRTTGTSRRSDRDSAPRSRRISRQRSVTEINKALNTVEFLKTLTNLESVAPEPASFQKPNRVRKEITITAVCVGAGFLFCSLAVFLAVIIRRKSISEPFCHSVDCIRHAIVLTNNINWQLDPCEDYAAFVCSAWEPSKKHRDLATTAMDDLRFLWYDNFKDTLSRGSLTLPAGKKPLAMYETCVKNFPKNASQFEWVRKLFESEGIQWPEAPAQEMTPLGMIVSLSYKWQWSFWITVNVFHPSSSGTRRVFVSPGLYLPFLRRQLLAVAQSYRLYWEQFLSFFYPDRASWPPVNQEAIEEIRKIERDIIDTLYDVSRSTRKRPAVFTFGEISSHVPDVSSAEWVLTFQRGLSLEPELNIQDEIIVTDVSLLETISKIMAKYDAVQLKNHIQWLIVQYFSVIADYSILVRYYGSAEKAEMLLPIYCAHHVEASFKALVLSLAYYTRFAERDHRTITAGFNSLVSTAVSRVQSTGWMDDRSKALVTEKLLSVKNALWPPAPLLKDGMLEKIYDQFPLHEPSYAHYWIKTRQAASTMHRTEEYDEAMLLLSNNFPEYADYDYVSNVVKLALGVPAPPAYYSSGTNAMLYGGLLFIMAMQLVKALDREGIRWTANGTLVDGTILTNSTLAAFVDLEACHHGVESANVFPEVPALEVAYTAFVESQLELQDGHYALGEKLPAERVFFMTLCFLTCASGGDRNPGAADCNKVVRNSDVFAHVYKCPRGSKMNPVKKCSFFIS